MPFDCTPSNGGDGSGYNAMILAALEVFALTTRDPGFHNWVIKSTGQVRKELNNEALCFFAPPYMGQMADYHVELFNGKTVVLGRAMALDPFIEKLPEKLSRTSNITSLIAEGSRSAHGSFGACLFPEITNQLIAERREFYVSIMYPNGIDRAVTFAKHDPEAPLKAGTLFLKDMRNLKLG